MAIDLMTGNFFMVTCPYLFELDTITYFSILRNHHSFQTIARIRGTTTPSLGVPVSFSEINNMTVLAEIAYEGGNLMPELSFGTHFFQDLVEGDIFYLAIFPQKGDVFFNTACFSQMPNLLTHFSPGSSKYTNIVKVYETDHEQLQIMCDIVSQKVVCFFT
jgi:hypothetical protein